jgi:hypothetical protein
MKLAKDQKFWGIGDDLRGQSEDFPLVPKVGRQRYPSTDVQLRRNQAGATDRWHIDPKESGLRGLN